MMKISALNEESSEESEEEDVPTITKEAQEQIALTEYNRALELLKENKEEDALNIFKDLLETELLDEVEKPEVADARSRPMLSLKYSCFKNIGAILASCEKYQEAIENYWEAANLDNSDVTLWYRIATLAMNISNLELACSSFKQGLRCNPNHWPCLDNMITALYAIPDYMNCLLYISMALEKDPSYVKGLAFRDKIFKDIPYLEECYKLYNGDWHLDPPLDTEYDRAIADKLIAEAKEVAIKWADACKDEFAPKSIPDLTVRKTIAKCTWVDLGETLIDMHKYIDENELSFVGRINFVVLKTDEKLAKCSNDVNLRSDNCPMLDEKISENVDVNDNDKDEKMNIDSEDLNNVFEASNDNQICPVSDNMMEVEMEEDKKSCCSDIQVIEDEDPLRMSDTDVPQFEEQNQAKNGDSEEQVNSEIDETGDKSPTEKMTDDADNTENGGQNEKSDEKTSEKADDTQTKTDEKTDGKEEGQKVKKRRRNALCFLHEWTWNCSNMRRSARVRSSSRKEAEREDVQLEEALRRIFPSTLLPDTVKLTKDDHSKTMDDSMDTMDLYQLFANQENNSNATEAIKSSESSKSPSPDMSQRQAYFGTESETAEVEMFINEHSGKSNLMIILAKFTEFLSTKWNIEWPSGLSEVYLQTYSYMREHIPHPSPFEEDEDEVLKLDSEMTLLFGELHTDRWLTNKPDILPSSTLDKLGTGLPSEELGHIIFTSVRRDILEEDSAFILLRVLWLKANIYMCQDDADIVVETLELLLSHIQELEKQERHISVKLPNCKFSAEIGVKIVEKKLRSIQRGQKLGEVQNLYDEKKYAELSCILQDTFKFAKQRNKMLSINDNVVDRVQQLSMLLDSLWHLQQYEECYVWAEACLNEAWQNYLNVSEESEQKKWLGSILTALEKLEACTSEVSTFVVKYLPDSRLARLVQNLVHIVCHQLDVSEGTFEMPLETVIPWILLHYILQYEEDKERAKSESSFKSKQQSSHYSESDDEDEGIPASIMILFTAHEFIGRHSWCCYNEAKLLYFTMNLVIPKLETPQFTSIKDKVSKYVEQIFYCLYGHCNKVNKSRPKYIENHTVPEMKLTWEHSQLLFDFYKPKQIPDFQSPRAASINSDTEILFRRIIKLVPQESDPNQIVEEMTAYIMGDKDKMPTIKKALPQLISTIYYLLGDFYLKNNRFTLAARYYLLDLCLNPSALNSWAGLALTTGAVLENSLNNYKPISEDKFLTKAKMAQSCYRHAIEIEPHHGLIWTEYGSFVYMVHSFCSRLLKQESETLSMERFAFLETRKEEMLDIADQCFQSATRLYIAYAGEIDVLLDERWLYQYMLGKVAEKKNQDPPIFLEYYAKASELLYEINAQYPRKISHKSPQNLALEALEVHYRIHASILKYLEQHEGKPLKKSLGQLLRWHLKNCSEGPFMKYQSKLNDKKEDTSDTDNKQSKKELEGSVEGDKNVGSVYQRSNSIEEIEIIDRTSKSFDCNLQGKPESRKRSPSEAFQDAPKRLKLGNVSHLQLMQDVVALIDDLISKVCDMVTQKEKAGDDIMVLSSDESNESRSQKKRSETPKNGDKTKQQIKTDDAKKASANALKVGNVLDPAEKTENVQDLMDALMKRAMEISQDARQSSPEDDDTRKFEGKWLQNDDLQPSDKDVKEKVGEKKRSIPIAAKEEVTLSRRGSQESTTTTQTTTTTTETNNSSSSSSDESSSSDDSSDSDSSSDSESESAESDAEKKKKTTDFTEEEENMSEEEVATLIAYCLAGLEQCILRFPEHHKSIYRLSHFFFNNKTAKDTNKCRDLLLGTYNCQFYPGQSFQGLFADRKHTNFFNGVWHIPNREVDRPGSFASHMSKSVTLLMQVLKETNDSRMLMELCVQLGKIPESDKKYLRDLEREQLSRQALTLCLQSLRTRVQSMCSATNVESVQSIRTDARTQVLLDVYKIYQQVQKHFQHKEQTVQSFATLLVDTYKTYIGNKNLDGNVLEIAIKCCQRQKLANKIANTNNVTTASAQPPVASPTPQAISTQAPINSTSPQTTQSRKPYKSITSTGRPRGRPPNVNKYLQAMQQSGNTINQFNSKSNFTNFMGASGNRSLMNPFFMNPLVDPNMLSLFAGGLGGNVIDPLSAMNYLNQVGSYQDMLRQYQSNLSSLTNLTGSLNAVSTASSKSSVPTMSTASSNMNTSSGMNNIRNLNNLTIQQLLSLSNSTATTSRSPSMYHQAASKTTTTTSMTKDRPNISITPVGTALSQKHKPLKQTTQADALPVQIPKSLQISQATKPVIQSTTQVSVLRPTKPKYTSQQVKASPPKPMAAPQIRVLKSLTEPQPAHNSSLSHSPLKNSNSTNPPAIVPQVAHAPTGSSLTIKQAMPMNIPTSHSGTSLQHKLLSKKNSQRSYLQTSTKSPMRKTKPAAKAMSMLPGNFPNLLSPIPGSSSMTQSPYIPPELSGISVSPVNPQTGLKGPRTSYKKPTVKAKPSSLDVPSSLSSLPLPQSNSVEALSMLTQLQQHSHLEIIPQQKAQIKPSIDYTKSLPTTVSVMSQKLPETTIRPANTECMVVYDLPRGKPSGTSNKKADKPSNDSVEIITLDD